ncbi:MAG: ATP-binding protein [Vulcanimicrobiaceae bacterium]
MFLERRVTRRLEGALKRSPAVLLAGPRQAGKTTLARLIVASRGDRASYIDLERNADLRRLDDAGLFLRSQSPALIAIDEIHRKPDLFPELRAIIDERRAVGERAGHFLLLGSASLDLLKQASESLAGRIAYVTLEPLDAIEARSVAPADGLWLRGGFPESLLADSDGVSMSWRRDFARSYLERDIPMFAPRLPSQTIGRMWTMLAHDQGAILNLSRLASSLGVSAGAVSRYVDLLVDLLLVRRLPPWSGNVKKRLVRSPKLYIRDSGIVHALLEIETMNALAGNPVFGPSYEGFVIENLLAADQGRHAASFFRTEDGAEIDLVLEAGGAVDIVVEIKRSSAPSMSRGFHAGREILRPKASFIVYPGLDEWPIAAGVRATSLERLMQRLDAWEPRDAVS